MFCRKVYQVAIKNGEVLGEGKTIQIDESKTGKRKYHHGHIVEGQWVVGGIEGDNRNSSIVSVEDRRETMLALINKWAKPGTTIFPNRWKGHINLENYRYVHKTVNHSFEFVNDEGFHTNKIERHWRQIKASLPTHGRKTEHYSSYLAEFIWYYVHRWAFVSQAYLNHVKLAYKFE